jgi:hypothetical protein
MNNEILAQEILLAHEKQKEKEFVDFMGCLIVDMTFRNVEEQKLRSLNIENQ